MVKDAAHAVAQADLEQVGRCAQSCRGGVRFELVFFFRQAVHLDRRTAFAGRRGGSGFFHGVIIAVAGGSRLAAQRRMPVEHAVRIRASEEGTPACGWAYFTYPALYFRSTLTQSFAIALSTMCRLTPGCGPISARLHADSMPSATGGGCDLTTWRRQQKAGADCSAPACLSRLDYSKLTNFSAISWVR